MKLRSFLTAASAVALMAGTAHANPLGFRMVDADGVDDNAQEEIVNLALESNDMSASASFEFEIFDVAGAEFPTQNDLDIVITLPEGVTFAAPGGNSTDPVSGTMGFQAVHRVLTQHVILFLWITVLVVIISQLVSKFLWLLT